MKLYIMGIFVQTIMITGCETKKLPYYGEPEVVKKVVDGKETEQTVYPTIPDFSFINEDKEVVTEKDFKGKVYVADFFFVTCPTICPVMKKNMLTVYKEYKDNPDVKILSHTIDPEHDTPEILKKYATDLGVNGKMWQFVTGDKEKIYDIGQKHYMVSALEDSSQAGGYIHSGAFVLVDKERHIRGMYDGTTEDGTAKLIKDLAVLLKE
ncbi:SCO family protein [Dyadobacter subterraneus]|uniref:SCO family protein n=1 Tax=Dyadobacter subterraneus TaxID=2773304 RepID=A0ABR9WH67_9BACT|nr:SCO family protein [Dyadobacter subterraneus]MBE9464469.1 SCO family protein [Dyadobacter subterraneus]